MKEIASGAEAVIYKDGDRIIKKRIKKDYRIPEIDLALRQFRTRREAKILEKLPIPGPRLIRNDMKENLEMSYVKGKQVKELLDGNIDLAREIGKKLAILHDHNIIHGDLTTSNMILEKEIKFIDFGLSFFSHKVEDKAVDIHLFKQALESKHYRVFEKAYDEFLKGYKPKQRGEILKRLQTVEARGRNK